MSLVIDDPDTPVVDLLTGEGEPGSDGQGLDETAADDAVARPIRLPMVALAAAFSASSAAWMAAGLIRGAMFARVLGLLGVAIGVGLVAVSYRLSRPAIVQYLVLPVAGVVGGIVISPVATGGSANLFALVADAVKGGGLLQPPIPFDPGWRVILVVLFAVLGASSLAMAIAVNRAKVAVVISLPITLGAALLQPNGSEVLASTVGIFLVIAALALAFGAEVAPDATDTRSFEVRRLLRGSGLLAILMVIIVALAQTNFLFPSSNQQKIIPPRKPPAVPPERDRQLFEVKANGKGPWRVGVLDVYDGQAWLLPPFDSKRVHPLVDGAVPPATAADFSDASGKAPLASGATPSPASSPAAPGPVKETVQFKLVDMSGRALPVPAGLSAVQGTSAKVEYDPRDGVPRLPSRVPRGFTYSAVATKLPTARELNAAPAPPQAVLDNYASAPPAPGPIKSLLAEAPSPRFDRLQFLRDRLYQNITVAGAGSPKDVLPSRVADMFRPGAEVTPFELTAAEALLARWADVPSRIGFGYHGGDKIDGGYSLRPKNGAAWLEVYFEGYGWVPLVGTPPQARSSLSKDQKNDDPQVKPSDELAVQVLIPIQRRTFKLLFEIVRYWVMAVTPFVVGLALLWLSWPALCKAVRRWRRRRWGRAGSPAARILAAYTEFRDSCHDLNIGDHSFSPLGFTWCFTGDQEHEELAWAVTRALWGDLRRDLRMEDAEETEALVASVTRRVLQAQPAGNRVVARAARASLKDPWSLQVPNFWPRPQFRRRLAPVFGTARRGGGRLVRALVRVIVPSRFRRAPSAAALLLVVVAMLFSGCVRQGGFSTPPVPTDYPARIVPDPPAKLLRFEFVREPKAEEQYTKAKPDALVTDGQVRSIRDGQVIQGTLQVALFRKNLNSKSPAIQQRVEAAIGGTFTPYWVGDAKLEVRHLPEQDLYIWFPPERNVLVSMYMRKNFQDADAVVQAIVAYVRGIDPHQIMSPSERRTSLGLPPVAVTTTTTLAASGSKP